MRVGRLKGETEMRVGMQNEPEGNSPASGKTVSPMQEPLRGKDKDKTSRVWLEGLRGSGDEEGGREGRPGCLLRVQEWWVEWSARGRRCQGVYGKGDEVEKG
ncbi:hypothetical protein Pcinc_042052 [Petrolisthes cinctipes]|uniref:Uncharacterized protein n=1 Tax=Petrolisthes cinctipes TaxID=88211 RepID=A0AAE1EH90_PETCI|nr:hypothetical protein Pcinc_042052 [Petrolisthes cinctipes]